MQIFLSKNRISLLLLIFTVFLGCGQAEDGTPEPVAQTEPILYGTVSGKVIDANTNNPIPGAVVKLFGLEVKTEVDGIFAFHGIPYFEEQNLTVHDPDYQVYTYTFTLNQERLTVDAALTPLKDPEDELNAFFESFSELIESLDFENLPDIQARFSESYVASDDPVTAFGILSGVIPPNFEGVDPTFVNIFQRYSWLQFVFKDRVMDITHARKASIEILLDVDSENAENGNLRHLEANCNFEFRREGTDWKIVYWQLLALDVGLQ
ncbi:MAG: carboxypeptidase regulatory-like domain-containing protein [Candidatus Poribacteria bacterium]|nr:carboxypeptidase regulatory-like domain-containing protein [Candidatus Poribacteria bacterium]